MAQASVVRPLNQVSQNPLHGSRSHFVESYLSAIPPDYFSPFFKMLDFQNFLRVFFFVFVNMGPNGSQNFKTLLLPPFRSDFFSIC